MIISANNAGESATLHIISGLETQLSSEYTLPPLLRDIGHATEKIHIAPNLRGIAGCEVEL